jgi:hypothetical protein
MHTIELKTAPELARIVRAADGAYRKTKARLVINPTCTLYGTYWDGGSRTTYTAVNLATMRAASAEQFAPPQFGGPAAAPTVDIPEGIAIVATGVFCGKPATASVYINPANAARLLPAV